MTIEAPEADHLKLLFKASRSGNVEEVKRLLSLSTVGAYNSHAKHHIARCFKK